MFDTEFSLGQKSKATLVSIVCPSLKEHANEDDTKRSLAELRELLRTLGIESGSEQIQHKKTVESATFLGSGKIQEIAEIAKEEGSGLLVFDFELSSSQVRNIQQITGLEVIDRVHVILEIFAKHAQTRESKIQIEILRLQYILPRLAGFWSHFSRQKGGVGVMGGEGEKQIELDKRIIKEKIEFFKHELEHINKSYQEQKKKRGQTAITAALVGYTNAGKSSLMNRLCHVQVLEENKLFATLDSTFRMLSPDTKPPMIMVDTVGFISNLPNTLIQGFKTTLESAIDADLLIIVCDVSDPHYEKHLEVTQDVLKELGADNKDQFIVFNKKDLLKHPFKGNIIRRGHKHSFLVSSYDEQDMTELRDYILNFFLSKQDHYDLFVPYEEGQAHSQVIGKTNVIETHNLEKGIFYRVKIPAFMFNSLNLKHFILSPDDPLLKEKL